MREGRSRQPRRCRQKSNHDRRGNLDRHRLWEPPLIKALPASADVEVVMGRLIEALRQEVTGRHVRVSLIEPGPVATVLFTHIRPEVLEAGKKAFATLLHAEDVADTITYVVSRPARVVMSETLVRPDGSQR